MKTFLSILIILLMNGCDNLNNIDQKETNTKTIITDGTIQKTLFNNSCVNVKNIHYPSPSSLDTFFSDTQNIPVYWDTRYTINKTNSLCHNGMEYSTEIDTRTIKENIIFGGPQSSLIYQFDNKTYPWKSENNLMMQVNFISNNYTNLNTNNGGNISFILFANNIKTGENISYVISFYSYGKGWTQEQPEILFDQTINTSFVSSILDKNSIYTTISNNSNTKNTNNGFFRTNITANQFKLALQNKGEKNIKLEDWYLSFIGIQFELEEKGGEALLSGSFKDFGAFITSSPM